MNSPIVPTRFTSPFDQIMLTMPDGGSYWSARDLMPLLGYEKWERFAETVERAKISMTNSGYEADVEASRRWEASGLTAQRRLDYVLSRFACYVIAQNGDPRKKDVADAQAYFAIQTRIAETQIPSIPDLTSLEGIAQLTLAAQNAVALAQAERERADLAVTRATKSEAIVDIIENGEGISIREFHKQYFSDSPERQFFNLLYRKKLLIDQRDTVWDKKNEKWVNGKDHGHPTYLGKPFFFLNGSIEKATGKRRYQTKVRPGKPEVTLIAKIETFGLTSNRNKTTLNMKELF